MQTGIRCMLMRGGTSKGAYFLAQDLPQDVDERDDLLLRIMAGMFPVRLEVGGSEESPSVERGGLIRTARALFDGTVFARAERSAGEVKA